MTPEIRQLQEAADRMFQFEPEPRRLEKMPPGRRKLVSSALELFDCCHLAKLTDDHKRLTAGDSQTSDVSVPGIFLRTVLREALSDLPMTGFVDGDATLMMGPTVTIPYSYRDLTAAGAANSRTYEGQEIARAGVKQAADQAYPIPQKLAFSFSDELQYLTKSAVAYGENFNVLSENINNLKRILAEDTNQLCGNEMLQASDEYGAVAVINENLAAKYGGGKRVFTLAHFPVVRPRRYFDLQGNQVGNTINPLTVTYNSTALGEYDGSGAQPPGSYYVINYNLGEIWLVNQSGAIQTPTQSWTVSYSYTNNTHLWDSDPGVSATDERWDDFLYRLKYRKSVLEDQRYYLPDFSLLSGVLTLGVEQAKSFAEQHRKPGTELDEAGSLYAINKVPTWKTAGPGLWYGDARVLIGQKGLTKFRYVKPLELSKLQQDRGPNGRMTGKKSAYAAQWVCVHTPTPLKAGYTTVTVYSGSLRVDRVDP